MIRVGDVMNGSFSRRSASTSAWFDLRAMLGEAARLPAASHHARNASSWETDGAMRSSTSKPCSTASGSIATVVKGRAPLRSAPNLVVGCPQRSRARVDQHQVGHPMRTVARQEQRAHRREPRADDRGPLAPDGVHYRDHVFCPARRRDLVRADARRHPHAAVVEADHPAERRQPAVEAVHRGFGVDRVDRDERARHDDYVLWTVAEYLVGDVQIAPRCVASPRSPRTGDSHGKRLVHLSLRGSGFATFT